MVSREMKLLSGEIRRTGKSRSGYGIVTRNFLGVYFGAIRASWPERCDPLCKELMSRLQPACLPLSRTIWASLGPSFAKSQAAVGSQQELQTV